MRVCVRAFVCGMCVVLRFVGVDIFLPRERLAVPPQASFRAVYVAVEREALFSGGAGWAGALNFLRFFFPYGVFLAFIFYCSLFLEVDLVLILRAMVVAYNSQSITRTLVLRESATLGGRFWGTWFGFCVY